MNIIELAKQANGEPAWNGGVDWTWDELGAFAKLVAEHEREACANLGEKLLLPETFFETTYEHDAHKDALLAYRNAIHARGTT